MNTGATRPLAAVPPHRPAGLLIRLAAMTYEAVLLFGVIFVVSYGLLAVARWTYPLVGFQRIVLQTVLFGVVGLYFIYQWTRSGQTLAMKAWNLRLRTDAGATPRLAAALVRYLAAWHLVLPGVLWTAFFGGRGAVDAAMFVAGFLLLLGPALFDARHRLLHDRISATRVIREG